MGGSRRLNSQDAHGRDDHSLPGAQGGGRSVAVSIFASAASFFPDTSLCLMFFLRSSQRRQVAPAGGGGGAPGRAHRWALQSTGPRTPQVVAALAPIGVPFDPPNSPPSPTSRR